MDQLSPVTNTSSSVVEEFAEEEELFGEFVSTSAGHRVMSTPGATPQLQSYLFRASGSSFNNQGSIVNEEIEEQPSTSEGTSSASQPISHTPKTSRVLPKVVRNPFERGILETLSGDMCSPNMFQYKKKKKSAETEENFEWSIEHKALLCPTEIPDSEDSQNIDSPSFERKANAVLNNYWNNVHYLPSPDPSTITRVSVISSSRSILTTTSSASSSGAKVPKTASSPMEDAEWLSDDEDIANGQSESGT